MIEKYQIRGSFRHGVKQYFVVDTQRTGMQVGLGEITHDPMQEHEAKFICAKLNRLTALETACREIVKSAPETEPKLGAYYGDPKGEDELYREWEIAQKLKAALEEK